MLHHPWVLADGSDHLAFTRKPAAAADADTRRDEAFALYRQRPAGFGRSPALTAPHPRTTCTTSDRCQPSGSPTPGSGGNNIDQWYSSGQVACSGPRDSARDPGGGRRLRAPFVVINLDAADSDVGGGDRPRPEHRPAGHGGFRRHREQAGRHQHSSDHGATSGRGHRDTGIRHHRNGTGAPGDHHGHPGG